VTPLPRHPTICLVTDRRRAWPAGDLIGAVACLRAIAQGGADGGIDIIQVRERDLEGAALADLVFTLLEAVQGSDTRIVVNDRADVAVACAADGVHLPADAMSAADARALVGAGLVGRSVHSPDDASGPAAAGADYLLAGTVFPTSSKPRNWKLLGADGLAGIVRRSNIPVIAIGGITLDRIDDIAAAGAAGVAAIGYFLDGEGGGCRSGSVAARARALRRRFDSVKAAP